MPESATYPADIAKACEMDKTRVIYGGSADGFTSRWNVWTNGLFRARRMDDFEIRCVYSPIEGEKETFLDIKRC